jgi:hypothetical protein
MVKPKSKSPGGSKKQASVRKADKKAVDKTSKQRATPSPHSVSSSSSSCRPSGVDKPGCRPQGSTSQLSPSRGRQIQLSPSRGRQRPPGGDKYSCRPPGGDNSYCRPPRGRQSSSSGGAASNRPSLPVSIDLSVSAGCHPRIGDLSDRPVSNSRRRRPRPNHGCLRQTSRRVVPPPRGLFVLTSRRGQKPPA